MKTNNILAIISFLAVVNPAAINAGKKLESLGVKAENVHIVRSGQQMKLKMDLDLSNLNLGTNEQVTFRPLLCTAADTVQFQPVVVNGRNYDMKIQRNPSLATSGAIEVKREKGKAQTLPYSSAVGYEEWMQYCDLKLSEDLCGCGHLKDQNQLLLEQVDNRPPGAPAVAYITPQAEAVKARDESGQAFVDFVVNKTDINPTYRRNRTELAKITQTIDLVKNDPFVSITNIDLHGYASPEGSYANNTRLASGRSESLKNYVRSLYDMPDGIFTSHYTPEDWGNLRKLVEGSTLAEKSELLAIIDSDIDYDAKDHEMRRRYPKTYAFMLQEWYPGLRHTDYKVSYVVRPLTIDEAKQVLQTNPKNLSLNEMFLVAQTYEPGSEEFNKVFETAVKVFPDDPTANLNAACTALNKDDLGAAAAYLEKAGDSPEAIHARGLLALKEGRYAQARRLLEQARDAGVAQAADNLPILDRTERLAKQAAGEE